MKDYQRILIGKDFSEASMVAAQRGADLARRYDAKLILLHVIEHFPEDVPNDPIVPENLDSATFYRERARKNLGKLAGELGFREATHMAITSTSSARHEIRGFAENEQVDLVVLGSHGGGLLGGLGSTAMGVTYDVPCDVIVVRVTPK